MKKELLNNLIVLKFVTKKWTEVISQAVNILLTKI